MTNETTDKICYDAARTEIALGDTVYFFHGPSNALRYVEFVVESKSYLPEYDFWMLRGETKKGDPIQLNDARHVLVKSPQ
jgi:hypothetical protein